MCVNIYQRYYHIFFVFAFIVRFDDVLFFLFYNVYIVIKSEKRNVTNLEHGNFESDSGKCVNNKYQFTNLKSKFVT